MKKFSQVVDIKTLVSDMKILCTVDQDVFHCQILLTRDTDWWVLPSRTGSECREEQIPRDTGATINRLRWAQYEIWVHPSL